MLSAPWVYVYISVSGCTSLFRAAITGSSRDREGTNERRGSTSRTVCPIFLFTCCWVEKKEKAATERGWKKRDKDIQWDRGWGAMTGRNWERREWKVSSVTKDGESRRRAQSCEKEWMRLKWRGRGQMEREKVFLFDVIIIICYMSSANRNLAADEIKYRNNLSEGLLFLSCWVCFCSVRKIVTDVYFWW